MAAAGADRAKLRRRRRRRRRDGERAAGGAQERLTKGLQKAAFALNLTRTLCLFVWSRLSRSKSHWARCYSLLQPGGVRRRVFSHASTQRRYELLHCKKKRSGNWVVAVSPVKSISTLFCSKPFLIDRRGEEIARQMFV